MSSFDQKMLILFLNDAKLSILFFVNIWFDQFCEVIRKKHEGMV